MKIKNKNKKILTNYIHHEFEVYLNPSKLLEKKIILIICIIILILKILIVTVAIIDNYNNSFILNMQMIKIKKNINH